MFIIDTSVWIFALKKNFHPFIKEKIDKVLSESDVAINGIIELELLGGSKSQRDYNRLKSRLDALYYIEASKSLWDFSSHLTFDLRKNRVNVPYTDIFIAASAIQEKAVLLHADCHFDTIAEHCALKVESLVSHVK
jgi:predicted nucleic acid-binding protein